MITLTMNVINRNETSFQVMAVDNQLAWIPYGMVTVINEVAPNAKVSDVGSITFEVSDALASRLKLVNGQPWVESKPTLVPQSATAEGTNAPREPRQVTPAPQFTWEFTVDTDVRPTIGRYTIVLTTEDDYVTLRLSKWENRPGVLIFSFLKGPDNATDYLPFAEYNVESRHFRTWRTFRHLGFSKYVEAATVLLSLDEEGQYGAGEAYALRSSNCCKCGRDLTVAKSIIRGMGPDCWMKFAPMDELRKMVEAMRVNV